MPAVTDPLATEEEDPITAQMRELGFTEVTDPEELKKVKADEEDPVAAQMRDLGFTEVTDPEELKRVKADEADPIAAQMRDMGFTEVTDPTELEGIKTQDRRLSESAIREKLKLGGYTSGMSSILGGGEALTGVKKGFLERTKDALNAAGRDIANEFSKPLGGDHKDPKKMEEEGRMRLNSVIGQEGSREKARKYLSTDRVDIGFDEMDKNALALLDKQDAEFEAMGITDPKERERYLKDAVKENMWTAEDKDSVRKLSTGELRINPAHIFGRRNELVAKIIKTADSKEDADEAIGKLDAMRAQVAATKADNLWYADKDYQKVATQMEEAGVTDQAQILDTYSAQQRKRGTFKKLGDMLISAAGEAGTGIAKTAVGTAAGVAALVGDDATAAELGGTQRMLGEAVSGSQEASNIRGLTGGFQVGKDLTSSGLQMAPMLIGGWATQGLKGMAGAAVQGMAVYGTTAAQGFESKLADAVSFETEKLGRDLTEDEIAGVLGRPETLTAAFLNAAQTALLSKVMGGGVERAALGKAAQSMTVKDFIKGGGMAALKDGTLRKELGGMLKTIRTDFTDEMAEEFTNTLLDGAIDTAVLDQEMKLGDLLGEAAYGGLLGGPLGGLIPQAMSRGEAPDAANPSAGTAPVVTSTPTPEVELKEISRTGLTRAVSKRLFELRSKQEGTAGDDQTIGTVGRELSPSETAELELLEKASADDDYETVAGAYGFKIKPPTVVTPVEKAVDELLPVANPVAPASVAAAEETPTAPPVVVDEAPLPTPQAPLSETAAAQTPAPNTSEQFAPEFNLTEADPDQAIFLSESSKAMGFKQGQVVMGNKQIPQQGKPAPKPAPTQEPEVKTQESGAQYTEGVTKKGTPKITWTRTKNGRKVGDEWNEGFAERVISEDNTSTDEVPSEYKVTTISQIINGDKGEVELATRDMTPEEMKAKRAKIEKENQQRKEMGFKEIPIPEIPTKPLPVKTELPTGSLPEGQTPTSGDVGGSAVAQPESAAPAKAVIESPTPAVKFDAPVTVTPATTKIKRGDALVTPAVAAAFKHYEGQKDKRKASRLRQEAAFKKTVEQTLSGEDKVQARRDMIRFFTGIRPRVDSQVPEKQLIDTFKTWLDNGAQTLPLKSRAPVIGRKDPEAVAAFKHSLVAQGIKRFGGIISKSAAIKMGKYKGITGQWDDAPNIKNPVYVGLVYDDTGELPSTIASLIFNDPKSAGALAGPNAEDLWAALGAELSGRNDRMTEQEAREQERLDQGEAFQIASELETENTVTTGELAVGDSIVMDGETLTVFAQKIDGDGRPETTSFKGGKKFGNQVVRGDVTIPVESSQIAEKVEEDMFAGEDTTPDLDSYLANNKKLVSDGAYQKAGMKQLRQSLAKVDVTISSQVSETGDTATYTRSAASVLPELRTEKTAYEALLRCLGGAAA